MPRIKRLQEVFGESYFEYLARLTDLVLLMDEAHRYRASAGARAINELKPILGLELTATPLNFKNVIYSYSLGDAMADGFVKEPAVATREDFNARCLSADRLETIKLEDGVHYHEHVEVELDRFHRTGRPLVHPFMLVVAQDTNEARRLRAFIESEGFFNGRYKGKVIEVHSALPVRRRKRRRAPRCPGEGQPYRHRHSRQQAERGLGRHQPLHHRSAARVGFGDPYRADPWPRPSPALRHTCFPRR